MKSLILQFKQLLNFRDLRIYRFGLRRASETADSDPAAEERRAVQQQQLSCL